MLFSQIIGQASTKKRLVNSVHENRISHAQLFLGEEGTGNLPLALAYAQFISCTDRQENDSCGKCSSCKKFQKLIHPDLHFVFPVATSKKITKDAVSDSYISEWRALLIESPYIKLTQWYDYIGLENKQGIINTEEGDNIIRKLNLKSFESDYKVMIIWMPEKMNISTANKLLKLVEEPPPMTVFLFVAETIEEIMPTILSRTQLIKIPRIDGESIEQHLRENIGKYQINLSDITNYVRMASGNFIKLQETIKTNEENQANFDLLTTWLRLCYSRKVVELTSWVESIAELGREKQKSFLNYALRMIRENFILNLARENRERLVYLIHQEATFSDKFSQFITANNVFTINEEINKAHFHIERNGQAKIIFTDLSLTMIKLLKT